MAIPAKAARFPESLIQLSRSVERVTYHNPDNGFCVLRVKAKSFRELITVVGQTSLVSKGRLR